MDERQRRTRLDMVARDCADMVVKSARKLPRHISKRLLRDRHARDGASAECFLALAATVFVAVLRDGSQIEERDQGGFIGFYASRLLRNARSFRVDAPNAQDLVNLIAQAADDYELARAEFSDGNSLAYAIKMFERAGLPVTSANLLAEVPISIELMSFANSIRDFVDSASRWAYGRVG